MTLDMTLSMNFTIKFHFSRLSFHSDHLIFHGLIRDSMSPLYNIQISIVCLTFALSLTSVVCANTKFVILHFNDFHSRIEPDSESNGYCHDYESRNGRCHGGIARMKTMIDQERSKGLPVLVLNAGDDFVGTEWDNRYRGKATGHFMNQLGITAMTLGNHEFDFGADVLLEHVKSLNYPVISANFEAQGHELGNYVRRHTITYVKNSNGQDVGIGICGSSTLYTNDGSNPWPAYMSDPYSAAEACVAELKSQGINIIILVTHIGFNGDKTLARIIPDVDIVIGGHSHKFIYNGTPPAMSYSHGHAHRDYVESDYPTWVDSESVRGKKVPVLTARAFSRYMGKVEVEFDSEGNLINLSGNPVLLGGSSSETHVTPDQGVVDEIAQWRHW